MGRFLNRLRSACRACDWFFVISAGAPKCQQECRQQTQCRDNCSAINGRGPVAEFNPVRSGIHNDSAQGAIGLVKMSLPAID